MDEVLPIELRSAFRLALKSTSTIVSALDETEKKPEIPVRRDLIYAILFSRSFLPTYLIVVGTVILSWSLAKWINKTVTRRRRQQLSHTPSPIESSASVSSSSSSTLQGTESPPLKNDFAIESTPLLADAKLRQGRDGPIHTRIWLYVRSILLYQPRPILAVTAPKNTLPANEVSVVIILFLALNVFYMFYKLPLSRALLFASADRAGLLFVVNLPVLYMLAAKNNQPLQWLTGWSYEGLNIFHRRLGEWMTVAAIVHAAGMVVIYYDFFAPIGLTLWWYLTRKIIILGMLALIFYLGIYVTSIGYVRQAVYEAFLALHIFLQVGALAFLFFHHHNARPYVGAALGIWVLDRGVSRIALKTKTYIATLDIAADKETILLYCSIPIRRSKFLPSGISSGWHAGQHVFLSIPSMGTKYQFQAHPFTIASPAPPQAAEGQTWPLQLTIRAQDGFSRELLEYAKLHQHVNVTLDGPYSSNEVLRAMRNSDRVCLIAGGSGIAVTYPFAWDRQAVSCISEEVLHDRRMYVNGRKQIPNVSKHNLNIDQTQLAHFWVRQESSHESWITMIPKSNSIIGSTPVESESGVDLITHRFDTRSASNGQKQRPDMRAELRTWVHGDHREKINVHQNICVIVSGPDGLVRDIQNEVASLVRDGWQIEIHVEKFGW